MKPQNLVLTMRCATYTDIEMKFFYLHLLTLGSTDDIIDKADYLPHSADN